MSNKSKYLLLSIAFFFTNNSPSFTFTDPIEDNRKICAEDGGEACVIVGDFYQYGEKKNQDYSIAATYYKLGCEKAHGQSCSRLSSLYSSGDGVEENFLEAWRLTRLACEFEHLFSCNLLGTAYERGFPTTPSSYDPPNYQEARKYYSYACQRGFGKSCGNLAAMYAYGVGVSKNVEEGRRLYEKACNLGSKSGCRGLKRLK